MAASKTSQGIRWVAAAGLLLLVAYIIIAHWLSFNPFRINSYVAVPDTKCMNVGVDADLDYTLVHPPYGEATRYEGVTYWLEADGVGRTPDQPFEGLFSNLEPGSHTIPSPVLRTTPPEVGDWRLVTDVEVIGKVLLFPRYTDVLFISEPVLTTLPADHPECVP